MLWQNFMTDLVILSHSRKRKTPSYSRRNRVKVEPILKEGKYEIV